MSKIKNGGLDQYGAGSFEQQFGTAGVERVNRLAQMHVHKVKDRLDIVSLTLTVIAGEFVWQP